VVGIAGYNLPLTIGDGSYQLSYITKNLVESEMDDGIVAFSSNYLIKTVVVDLTVLAVCQGFGFVGGQIFPTMFAGYLSGIVAFNRYGTAFDLAVPCMMCAVPCAFVPTPMTFVFMVAILFGLDGIHTTYVLISVITSFGANCGLGLVQNFLLSKVRKDLRAKRPNDYRTGFSGDGNDPFGAGGMHPNSAAYGAAAYRAERTNSDGFGYGLNPRAMSEILQYTFFDDDDDDDDDDDKNDNKESKLFKANNIGEEEQQPMRGSVLGPRTLTATFGLSVSGHGVNPFDYGNMDDDLDGYGYRKGGYGGSGLSRSDHRMNRSAHGLNRSGHARHLDQVRDPNNQGGLIRASSSGPGIHQSLQSPDVHTQPARERGRGPTSLEARIAAARRYSSNSNPDNSTDQLPRTKM
jgi:hypothetical protein